MNMILEKLSFLILSLSLVTGLPVEPNLELMATIDDSEVHSREVRSLIDELGWHLDRIDQRSLPLDGRYSPLATGSGVDIYMFGEGINLDHEEFEGRAFDGGYRWLRNPRRPKDCSRKFHGTQVASLAVGKSVGVATKANIYSIKVLNCQLAGYFSDVIRGIQYVINATKLTGRRSVIALPLIGPHSPAVDDIIEQAVRENIVLVAAAGNFLQDACSYSPASSPHVITVGGTEKDDRLLAGSAGSNFGKCLTLYAPARSILAAAGGNNGYRELSGTSSSCGIVAGAAALVLEKFPHYTPQQVKEYLIDQSTPRVVQTSSKRYKVKPNRFLYVGEEESDFDGSGSLGVVFG